MKNRTHAQRVRHGRRSRATSTGVSVTALIAAFLVAVIVAAWVVTRDGGGSGPERAEVVHVHGLGVNPADDDLYVATHHGVFRITEAGKATRVGDSAQDTMGFTVAGPDRFLASGHPDLRDMQDGAAPLLGLIESTDAGKTWRSLSLEGQADFHGLAAAHGLVYGYDSTGGRFMVRTADGSWEVRSTLQLADFAVDPSDADHIVGAGADGLLQSVDGGRSWTTIDGPTLSVLSWASPGSLFGAAPDGTTHRSADGGNPWSEAGDLPGQPQALLALPEILYAAASNNGRTGIYRSQDGAQTWSLFYQDPA